MPRIRDVIGRHAQPRRRTAAGVRTGGGAFPTVAPGRAYSKPVFAWGVSTWGNAVWGPGGRFRWSESQWGAGDRWVDESTGKDMKWSKTSYWKRCQWPEE